MKRQGASAGYTIIEVMIFLVVSGGLLISVMTVISGQQEKMRFSTGINEFESAMRSQIASIETGYIPSNGDLTCAVNDMDNDTNAYPVLTVSGVRNEVGTSQDCVFLGKAIQFYTGPEGYISNYHLVPIAGKRLDYNTTTLRTEEPQTLQDSEPIPYYTGVAGDTVALDEGRLTGVEVTDVKFLTSIGPAPAYTATYTTGMTQFAIVPAVALRAYNNTTSNLANGRVVLAALPGNTNYTNNSADLLNQIRDQATNARGALSDTSIATASRGMVICLRDQQGGRTAAVTVGLTALDSGDGVTFRPQPTNQSLQVESFIDNRAAALGCTAA